MKGKKKEKSGGEQRSQTWRKRLQVHGSLPSPLTERERRFLMNVDELGGDYDPPIGMTDRLIKVNGVWKSIA